MQIKRQQDTLSSMIDYISSMTTNVTDFTVGSAVRSILDAVSIENETLYLMTYNNVSNGILEGMFSAFGFTLKKATPAKGYVTLEFFSELPNPVSIDKGTRFSNGDPNPTVYYETREEYVIPSGTKTATVQVYATVDGSVGNVLAGEITHPETSVFNVSRVYNSEPFLTGYDGETYVDAQKRFANMVEGIGKSTKASVIYGALSVEDIQLVQVDEHVGYFDVYAGDANGELTTQQQKSVSDTLDDYRAAGIKVNVFPIDRVDVDIDMDIIISKSQYDSASFRLALNKYVYDYLDTMLLDGDFIISDFMRYVMNFDPTAIYDAVLNEPSDNYITSSDEVIRAGNVNINFSVKG